eukprot:gnl/TRDRNA2_/TRDRNA2_189223_c0_seq1.p1 gnl/TRDRNA2_/TRDRNA2_189223_c0~~gnl/TRDRNA2_/TRDRNA2_189223_c0_seq1.p1  ORF type:complete len:336 (+),score=54.44 gnl/TRDRNA2_/TRDRNA2_189223_c0_seq1:121-1128(+)
MLAPGGTHYPAHFEERWMGPELGPVLASRDHLLAGCISFTLFVGAAWLCAVFNKHHLKATLSEMVHDWDTAEGKIFIPALLMPAIFFLISGYPYVLPNARVDDHPWGHFFIVLRHFCVNAGLVLVAFVPTIPEFDRRAEQVEVAIHGIAAALAFLSFILSEAFVFTFNTRMKEAEVKWRKFGIALMTSSLLLLAGHKLVYQMTLDDPVGSTGHTMSFYCEAWTFRYEMLLGAGLIFQNQLVWHFSDPLPASCMQCCFYAIAFLPYMGAVLVMTADFLYRGNMYALSWGAMELGLFTLFTVVMFFIFGCMRSCAGSKPAEEDKPLNYGATDSKDNA